MCISPLYGVYTNGAQQWVPCGQCIECRLKRQREWALRIVDEARYHSKNCFLTLTYSEDSLPKNGSLCKKDLQDFFKRLRSHGYVFRYFASGEYGDKTHRPHYHVIVFGYYWNHKTAPGSFLDLEKIWGHGQIRAGDVNENTASYVAKYTIKKYKGSLSEFMYQGLEPEFAIMSRRPGIGDAYRRQFAGRPRYGKGGVKINPPRYYRSYNNECFDVARKQLLEARSTYIKKCQDTLIHSPRITALEYDKLMSERRFYKQHLLHSREKINSK